jgi:histone H3
MILYYVALYVAFSEDNVDISANDFIIVALREIRRYQKSSDLLIASTSFSRLVKEILHENSDTVDRVQASILTTLQKAAKSYVVSLLKDE